MGFYFFKFILKILGPFKSGILFFWKDPENVDLHDLAQEINKIQGKSFKVRLQIRLLADEGSDINFRG
jgi:hypothetical protein